MTINNFKLAYKNFLVNVTKHTQNSSNKYISYINKACSLPNMNDLWERLSQCDDTLIKSQYVEELCDAIINAFNDPTCVLTEKELRDSQSSAHVLWAFVSGQKWTKHKGLSVQFTSIYNKKMLHSKFLSRLTTQDRIYSFGSFPINIINGMANRKKISLFDNMIDEIKIIYNNKGNYFYFKDITCIMLATDGHAYFEKDGAIYPIFTQIPRENPVKYCIAKSPKIDDLSLDHDNPIENVLKNSINSMPILTSLSEDILKFKLLYKKTNKKADNRTVLGAYKSQLLKINEDELIKETEWFLKKLSLTIMQRNFNSSKSNNVVAATPNKKQASSKPQHCISPKVYTGDELAPYEISLQGGDQPNELVSYAESVQFEQQVPGLCRFLYEEYRGILDFSGSIFGNCFLNGYPDCINVELRQECPSKIYTNNDEYVKDKINNLISKGNRVETKEVSNILRFHDRILGEFIGEPDPKIVIYFRQFEPDQLEKFHAAIVETLAHEFAHYLEYVYCKNYNKKSYQDARVSEAIADFFGVLYSIRRGENYDLEIAKKRYNLWKKRFGSGWPYAYALYFYSVYGNTYPFSADYMDYQTWGSIQKLKEVFEKTNNARSAFKALKF